MAYDYSQFYKTKSSTGYDIFRQGGQKLSYEEALPMFQSGFNVEFIKEQQPIQQPAPQPTPVVSQSAPTVQPPQQPAQPIEQPKQNTNPTSYYKVNTGNVGVDGRPAYDIYDAVTNQKISAEQGTPLFAGGLNVEFIPEKPVAGQQPTQPPQQSAQPVQGAGTAQQPTIPEKPATGLPDASGGASTTELMTQKPYVQYAGSPDIFERKTGTYIPAEQAKKLGINNALQVEQISTPRPDIKTEADFAKLAQTNLKLQQSGVTVTPEDFQNNPLKAFQDTYSQIWTNLGLTSVKEQIETTLKAMKEVDNEMIDKIAEVNDNPWITEGARSREVTKLQNKYEQKNAANTGNLKLLQGLYDMGRQEAQFTAQNAMEAYYKQQTFDQQILLKQMDLAEKMSEAMNKKSFRDLVGSDGRMHSYIVSDETGEKLVDLGVSEMPKAGGISGTGEENQQLYVGLTPQTATAVRGQVSAFKSEPTIQNFAVVQEGRNFAQSISDTTKNPADDQGLIYSLAKALDPGSVVREGEYATAQKYAQSWVKAYGKGVEQALFGIGFLSVEARQNIKKTIESKYNASRRSYDNLYNQYTNGINNLTGRNDGTLFLRDYIVPEVKAPESLSGDMSQLSNQEFLQSIPTFGPPAPTRTDNKSFFGDIYNWLTGK